jgi:hypothetical protein
VDWIRSELGDPESLSLTATATAMSEIQDLMRFVSC